MKKIFTLLVSLALFFQLLLWAIPYAWPMLYNEQQLSILSLHGYGSFYDLYGSYPYILMFLYLSASIGVLLFKPWAKPTFLVLTLVSIFTVPFMGVTISEPIIGTLGYIITLIDGSILTMLYFTSVSNEFIKSA